MGNPFAQLNEQINWEEFRSNIAIINEKDRKSAVKAGETPVELNQQENKSVLIKKDFDARWTKKRIKKITTATRATSTTIKEKSSSLQNKKLQTPKNLESDQGMK